MASIQDQLKNARTLEDIINLLTILFTNMNNQNEIYYDMFINPEPMDLELERYNEEGVLQTYIIPNRAKDRILVYSGNTDPNGYQVARVGALYINTATSSLFYKATGDGTDGWAKIWSSSNLERLSDISTDASDLVDLNLNATSSILSVVHGGTDVGNITGLIKGTGTSAFQPAEPGVDYLAPVNVVGVVAFYPVDTPPSGWLVCDGSPYPIDGEYNNLYNVIGSKYNLEGDSSDEFRVPNLIGKYIKCDVENVGVKEEGQVGTHNHELTGQTEVENQHTHGRGTMNIRAYIPAGENVFKKGFKWPPNDPAIQGPDYSNPFERFQANVVSGRSDQTDQYDNDVWRFNAANSWSGETGTTEHRHDLTGSTMVNKEDQDNEVAHIKMLPMIKY